MKGWRLYCIATFSSASDLDCTLATLEYMLGCVMVGGGIITCDSAAIGEYCDDFSNARARLLLKMRITGMWYKFKYYIGGLVIIYVWIVSILVLVSSCSCHLQTRQ